MARITDGLRGFGRRLAALGWGWWACVTAFAVVNLLQSPGRTTFDTKLDLLINPAGFLHRSLELWSPASGLGELQNQAYGYLFPIGPFFLLGDWLGIAPWILGRIWSFLLCFLAFEGVRRLARAWGGLGDGVAVACGLAYVVAPRFLTTVGVLTGETLPTVILPWTVLPLVLARRGRLDPFAAAGLSACSVLFMGGHNAVETLATLPLPAVVLIAAVLQRQLRLRHLGTWLGCLLAVCWWWLGPLLLLGRYSPPFLDYIESARTTTGVVGWFSAVRGTDHWLAYITLGDHPWWATGFALATSSALIVVTVALSVVGLIGLLRTDIPDRATLLVPMAIGLTGLVAAHGGWAGGLFAAELRELLDGPLAPLRNIHKVDPLVRLPLALGFGFAVRAAVPPMRAWWARRGRSAAFVSRTPLIVGLAAAFLLAAAAQPALAGKLRFEPGWDTLPSAWQDAAAAVDALPSGSRVLIAPGSGFGLQEWGYTVDETLQPLTETPWAVRGQAPLAPGQSTRMMDELEGMLSSGVSETGLQAVLRRAGITHVLVRFDLDRSTTDAPDPDLVVTTFERSGLEPVDDFGTAPQRIELWAVPDVGTGDPRVAVGSGADLAVVQGGAENAADLVATGVIGPNQPALLASDGAEAPIVVTDGMQRRERNFGRVHGALSSIMARYDGYRLERAVHDFAGDDLPQTVAWYPELSQVVATGSAGYADNFGAVHPQDGPYSALDGDSETAWVTAPFSDPVDSAIRIGFTAPESIEAMSVTTRQLPGQPRITAIRLTTDRGEEVERVSAATGRAEFRVDEPITRLEVAVAGVDARRGDNQVAISEIALPGVDTSRYLVPPGTIEPDAEVSYRASPEVRACTGYLACDAGRRAYAEEASGLFRTLATETSQKRRLAIRAVARATPETLQLVAPLASDFTLRGSSVVGNDPSAAAILAVDGNLGSGWISAPGDPRPTLSVDWPGVRTISSIRVDGAPTDDAVLPREVRVTDGRQSRVVRLDEDGSADFPAIAAKQVELQFAPVDGAPSLVVPELTLGGAADISFPLDPERRTGEPCGFGPQVVIDDKILRTRVVGTLGDVLAGAPMEVEVCRNDEIDLGPGLHRLQIRSTPRYQPVRAELGDLDLAGAASPAADGGRSLEISDWTSTEREVEIGAGDEAIFWVRENTNPGWQARYAGAELTPVAIDGWAQGWRVPAGGAGPITLTYGPQHAFESNLRIGALLAVLAVFATLLRWWFASARGITTDPGRRTGPVLTRRMSLVFAWEGVVALAVFAGAGIAVGAVVPLVPWLRRTDVRAVTVAVLLASATGLYLASTTATTWADALVSVAVGVVLSPVIARATGGRW